MTENGWHEKKIRVRHKDTECGYNDPSLKAAGFLSSAHSGTFCKYKAYIALFDAIDILLLKF